ncbi:MAG: glycine zipper 2TM domain-containing protein [Proteobacteria bacterium]|jgi:surface antigen|nr:glycine zipper 2TM domain-containing protein [Pseudomonadota bacterium]
MNKTLIGAGLVSITLLAAGCSTLPSKQQQGAAAGAVVGGVLGSALGKGHSDRGWATALGVIFGAVIGDQIGAQLDERDRLLAAQNLQYSLESTQDGAVTTWQNPNTGHSGTATPTKTSTASNGAPCREFTTEIQVGGETQQGYGTACRQADGSWKIQS